MAADLLSTIQSEIDARLSELRPLFAEYERLLVAAAALVDPGPVEASADASSGALQAPRSARARRAPRGSAAGAIRRAAAAPLESSEARDAAPAPEAPEKARPERAQRGAAREAILAALEHGSHTVGELAVVTAMSGPNINGNLRRLVSEGAVAKTEREGKVAYVLPADSD
jgi:DNA-binding transcriptional ArsR family regulator